MLGLVALKVTTSATTLLLTPLVTFLAFFILEALFATFALFGRVAHSLKFLGGVAALFLLRFALTLALVVAIVVVVIISILLLVIVTVAALGVQGEQMRVPVLLLAAL